MEINNKTNLYFSRRQLLAGSVCSAGLLLSGCSYSRRGKSTSSGSRYSWFRRKKAAPKPTFASLYGALPNEEFPVPALPEGAIEKRFYRQRVRYKTREKPGTLIVDTQNFYLYHIERRGRAMRYGVGLGKAGFEWAGTAEVLWKQKWPKWTPPDEMIARKPSLRKYSEENGGMPGGLKNPLGARALYIFQDNKDTLYRLHGTPQYSSIGKAVSSGCVRMIHQDVIDLYNRVKPRSKIIVT